MVINDLSDPNDPIYSDSLGSNTYLPNGDIFVDYGEVPVMKEFSSSNRTGGTVRWTWRFGLDNLMQSYRGFKVECQGFPTTSPDLVVEEDGKGRLAGYVSWNGATNVEEWVIYEGWAHDKLSQVSRVGYQGFETEFRVDRTCAQWRQWPMESFQSGQAVRALPPIEQGTIEKVSSS